jgi:hypothetical protein
MTGTNRAVAERRRDILKRLMPRLLALYLIAPALLCGQTLQREYIFVGGKLVAIDRLPIRPLQP